MVTVHRKGALFIKISGNKSHHKSHQESKLLRAYSYKKHFSFLFSFALKYIKRASFRRTVTCPASVSIEASVAIPVFLFCFLEVLSLLNYLSVYSGVLYAMKCAADPIAVYAYTYDQIEDDKEISIGEEVCTSIVFSEAYLDNQIRQRCDGNLYQKTIQGGKKGISLLGSHIDFAEDCVDVVAYYKVKPMVSFAGSEQLIVNRYYTKLWTGYNPQRTENSGLYVYVTENGSVYHKTELCTYLKLSISEVESIHLHAMRNEYGKKYSECMICCDDDLMQETYYITKQGERYHEKITCSGLRRTIYRVEKKRVEDWSMCSRCYGTSGEEK